MAMNKRIIYELKGYIGILFRVTGYEFGAGEKSVCIVGSSRGMKYSRFTAVPSW